MFGVMRFQPFKVCKCKFISTVICVASLSYVHKSDLLVKFLCVLYTSHVFISSWLMLLCEQVVFLYRKYSFLFIPFS